MPSNTQFAAAKMETPRKYFQSETIDICCPEESREISAKYRNFCFARGFASVTVGVAEMNRKLKWVGVSLLAPMLLVCGCGGGGTTEPPPVINVTVSPAAASLRAGSTQPQTFTATVTGTTNTAVTWEVNNVAGGNSTVGTIDVSGNYVPPAAIPNPNSVSVQAVSVASALASGSSAVTLMNPVPVVAGVSPPSIQVGAFTLTVTGSDFVQGSQVMFGGTALTTTFVSSTQLTATGTATAAQVGSVIVTVNNPDPGAVGSTTSATVQVALATAVTSAAAVRFLEQSAFGPTPALVAQVQQSGFVPFLMSQFTAAQSTYPDPATGVTSIMPTAADFFHKFDVESRPIEAARSIRPEPDFRYVQSDGAAARKGAIYAAAFTGRVHKLRADYAGRHAESGDGFVFEHGG